MGVFKAEISTEAHEIQATLDRNAEFLEFVCSGDKIPCSHQQCWQGLKSRSVFPVTSGLILNQSRLLLAVVSFEAVHSAPHKRCCRMRPLAHIYIAW